MAKRHTPEFEQEMIKFHKSKKNASPQQARKHAKALGYVLFSQAAHDRFRKEAGDKTKRGKARKARGRKQENPQTACGWI